MLLGTKRSSASNLRTTSELWAILIGILSFLTVVGGSVLIPWNIAWFTAGVNGDMLQHYLGWSFFRQTPWGFPLGINPRYGLDINSSIIYTDSIPILALIFKLLNPILGTTFQYFGFWLLVCFVFHSLFTWKILRLFAKSFIFLVSGTVLSIFSPIFLFRINMHMALAGQFLILIAIYLYLNESSSKLLLKWKLLLFSSILIHAYLFFIIFFLWISFLLTSLKTLGQVKILKSFTTALIGLLLLSYVVGYFVIVPKEQYGANFGVFRWNLLSPLVPGGWSTVLNTAIPMRGNGEGFSYLGLGLIILCGISLILGAFSPRVLFPLLQTHWILLATSIWFAILALSNQIAIGNLRYSYPLPKSIIEYLSIFRASGRFIWPVIYLLLFFALILFCKLIRRQALISPIVILLAITQVMDTNAGWRQIEFRKVVPSSVLIEYSSREFQLANKFRILRIIPTSNENPFWLRIGYLASLAGAETNAVYLSRIEREQVIQSAQITTGAIASGSIDKDTLYVLTKQQFLNLERDILRHSLKWELIDELYFIYMEGLD